MVTPVRPSTSDVMSNGTTLGGDFSNKITYTPPKSNPSSNRKLWSSRKSSGTKIFGSISRRGVQQTKAENSTIDKKRSRCVGATDKFKRRMSRTKRKRFVATECSAASVVAAKTTNKLVEASCCKKNRSTEDATNENSKTTKKDELFCERNIRADRNNLITVECLFVTTGEREAFTFLKRWTLGDCRSYLIELNRMSKAHALGPIFRNNASVLSSASAGSLDLSDVLVFDKLESHSVDEKEP